jgi:uncharacterized phage protein (TIGR02218 family)
MGEATRKRRHSRNQSILTDTATTVVFDLHQQVGGVAPTGMVTARANPVSLCPGPVATPFKAIGGTAWFHLHVRGSQSKQPQLTFTIYQIDAPNPTDYAKALQINEYYRVHPLILRNSAPGTAVDYVWVYMAASQSTRLCFGNVQFFRASDPIASLQVTAKVAGFAKNTLTTTETMLHASWGGGTLAGGADAILQINDGETVTVGGVTYRFKTTMAAAYDVKITTSAELTLQNLNLAINVSGTVGVNYFAGTLVNPQVSAVMGQSLGDLFVTATSAFPGAAGNAIAATETMTNGAWSDATLVGGTTATYLANPGFSFSSLVSAAGSGAQGAQLDFSGSAATMVFGDLRFGVWDQAQCEIDIVNWQTPNGGKVFWFGGQVGSIVYQNDGTISLNVIGIMSVNRPFILPIWSPTCRADLGDMTCRINIDALKKSFTVNVVSADLISFSTLELNEADNNWALGILEFQTGANAGLAAEVATSTSSTKTIKLLQSFPYPIVNGDTGVIWPGCDKNFSTCRDRYFNTINFQGEPFWPGYSGLVVT